MSSQQWESSFPLLQKRDTVPFFASPPGTHHTHGVLVSEDNIALSGNIGILETAASVPATSPIKISIWGDLEELEKGQELKGYNLGALALVPKACAGEQGGVQTKQIVFCSSWCWLRC